MGRVPRLVAGGVVYHVLNRANERAEIFERPGDYAAFEDVLREAKERFETECFAYCIMPNHWHLIVRPKRDGDLPAFMHWLTVTHSQRWRKYRETEGHGHLYQGTYRSFPVQDDRYFLAVCRYVERNPLRAKLVGRAEEWQWSSAWRRLRGDGRSSSFLDPWPFRPSTDYVQWLNEPQQSDEVDAIRCSVKRGIPYGDTAWVEMTVPRSS